MSNRLCCSPARRLRVSKMRRALLSFALVVMGCLAGVPPCAAGDAPAWMHALVSAPLPAYDEKTDAVLLYYERIVQHRICLLIVHRQGRTNEVVHPRGS